MMQFINYISVIAIPFTIFFIITYGLSEKLKVFDIFIQGCTEGINIVIKIFPTLVALFLSISALRNSGIIDMISKIIAPLLNLFSIPLEIFPLILVRPISGSGATAVAVDIMQRYGVDTLLRYDSFLYYGSYRNHSIHNRNLYRFSKNKKDKIFTCISSYSRCRRNAFFYNFLSNFVVKFFLTFVYFCCIMFTEFGSN